MTLFLESFFRYIHFTGILLLFSAIVAQHTLIQTSISKQQLKKLSILNMIYAAGAFIAFSAGFILLMKGFAPYSVYTTNTAFQIKMVLFVLLVFSLVFQSRFFFKLKHQAEEAIRIPVSFIWLIRMQMLVLLAMPFLATLAANGL